MLPGHRYDKVSIAGNVGSGKSVVARLVAERTGWPLVSTGALFRSIAERRGMSVLELNEYAEDDGTIDEEVDGRLRALANSDEKAVIDSRMAWHFVPSSLKVYLVVDHLVGAERVFDASRSDERYATLEDAVRASVARQRVEADRYHALYGVRRDDWRNYQLVVDTTHSKPERVAELIVESLGRQPAAATGVPECWLSPRRLVPGEGENDGSEEVRIAVFPGLLLIMGGHAVASAALAAGDPLILCRLVAFEPGTGDAPPPAAIRERVSLRTIREWEENHAFRFAQMPPWVIGEG